MPKGIYIRKPFSEEHLLNMSKSRIGKKTSLETKTKMSISQTGLKRRKFTDAARENMSIAQIGKKRSIETRRKRSEMFKGKNNPNYKGGVSPKNKRIRMSMENRLWRESVFARDNFACQKTGNKGMTINAHHIKNFSNYPELRFVIDNGITLSEESHKEFHKIYGRKNNTVEQIIEFLK